MKRKCDRCQNPATHHSVEIIKGQKIEKHLCDACAAEEGYSPATPHSSVNELLNKFIQSHSGTPTRRDLVCEDCGLTFLQFRERSLLGCPGCYAAFEKALDPLLERAQEGGTHHLGKVPRRAGAGEQRQAQLLRMRKRLSEAVNREDYELAARLRDDINQIETDLAT